MANKKQAKNKEKVVKVQELRRSNAATYQDPRPNKLKTKRDQKNKAITDSIY